MKPPSLAYDFSERLFNHARRWRTVVIMGTLVRGLGLGLLALALHAVEPPAVPTNTSQGSGEIATYEGVTFALLVGDGTQCGTQTGTLLKDRLKATLRLTSLRRDFHLAGDERAKLLERVSPDHRAEMNAAAAAASVVPEALIDANLVLDTQCTALVTGADGTGPLRLARNMDYFPAGVLGPATVVSIVRSPGKHAFASIGWPGYSGVISGMNDAGLCAVVLRNQQSHQKPGTPLAFRVREILEQAGDVDQAVTVFNSGPVATGHFVVVADAKHAAVLWYDGSFHRRDPQHGQLTCSNGEPGSDGDQNDRRTKAMRELISQGLTSTDDQLKQALTRVYLLELNAQAMLFRPERKELDLALGTGGTPAAKASYACFGLGSCLDGKGLDALVHRQVGPVTPLSHY